MKAGTGVHMTPGQLRAWTRFLEASRRLEHALAAHLKADHGMLHSEYEILVRVDGAGGKMRMGVLASQIVESHSMVSHTVSRLEERGWVRRDRSAEDGRGFDVVITERGSRDLGEASQKHAALIKELLLADLSDRELSEFTDQMQGVINRIERGAGLEPPGPAS